MKGRLAALCVLSMAAVVPTAGHGFGQETATLAPAAEMLSDERRIANALGSLKRQRPEVVDAYVVVAALDTDAVFGREAREAGRVLARRFDADGRTIVLAEDEGTDRADAAGTPRHLALALARAGSLMDRTEDVLILYSTATGLREPGSTTRTLSGEQE